MSEEMISIPKAEFVKLIDEMTENYSQMFKRLRKVEKEHLELVNHINNQMTLFFTGIEKRLEALEK